MKVSRTRRFIGTLINVITFNFLIIGNLYLLFTKGKTLGGSVMGYKYSKSGIETMVKILVGLIISGFMWGITFGIMFIYDVVTMSQRNGWLWENWLDCKKTNGK